MLSSVRRHLTYANVIATIALFVAFGGGAYAAATIGARDIQKNAVRSKHMKNQEVRSADVRNNNLRGVDVRNDSLTAVDLLESSLGMVPSAQTAGKADDADRVDGRHAAELQEPRAYGAVLPNGSVALTKNLAETNVVNPASQPNGDPLSGLYCFYLPFDVRHVQATALSNSLASYNTTASPTDSTFCPRDEDADATVSFFAPNGAMVNGGFFVSFFE